MNHSRKQRRQQNRLRKNFTRNLSPNLDALNGAFMMNRNAIHNRLNMGLGFALIAAVKLSDEITVVHRVYLAAGVRATVHEGGEFLMWVTASIAVIAFFLFAVFAAFIGLFGVEISECIEAKADELRARADFLRQGNSQSDINVNHNDD